MEHNKIRIGEVYMMTFDGTSSEQAGYRPGLVIQNNTGNEYSPNIIALPMTSSLKKMNQPTHVLLKSDECGVPRDSVIICENPQRMSKDKIGKYITKLSNEQMAKVAYAYTIATSVISFIDISTLTKLHHMAKSLNNIN